MWQADFRDQIGNVISLPSPPKRIVSLVPSQTELLHDLGLDHETVGITKFCELPAWWSKQKSIIGGTKNFWFDVIDELSPELILGNKEENYEEGIRRLREKYPVWMSDIVSVPDALAMIEAVGQITDRHAKAVQLRMEIQKALSTVQKLPALRTLYLIWYQPWMCAAADTFINSMIQLSGLHNVLEHQKRYPTLTADEMAALEPELILLPSEPFPFRKRQREELKVIVPNAKLMEVDGKIFSWYGSRLRYAADYFQSLAGELSQLK